MTYMHIWANPEVKCYSGYAEVWVLNDEGWRISEVLRAEC